MGRLRSILARESGQAMVIAVFTFALLTTLAVALTDVVTSESQASGQAVSSDASYQAAEAGIDNYVSKLLDDHLYYQHYVDAAESTRTSGSLTVGAGQNWTGGITWTYASKDNWETLGNGYAYNLEITGPTGSASTQQEAVQIISTGCRWNAAATPAACMTGVANAKREIQMLLLPSSAANWQMIANTSISYGSAATTNGRVYSNANITHDGTATANLYAEGNASGSTTFTNGATAYDASSNPTFSSVIPNPIDFSTFVTSISDIKRAAQTGGVYLTASPAADPDAWEIVFNSNGTFTAAACNQVGGLNNDVSEAAPSCGTPATYNVPSNGAIYADATVIIGSPTTASAVNGRVTVTSNNNIVIGNNISYQSSTNSVLGLVAKNDMVVAYWSPSTLTWSAATTTQSGQWTDTCGEFGYKCGSHTSMTFNGSTATDQGGSMSMFNSRTYNYDSTLLWLDPPWYPTIQDPYTILFQRELTPS
jgi:hypothetical protein